MFGQIVITNLFYQNLEIVWLISDPLLARNETINFRSVFFDAGNPVKGEDKHVNESAPSPNVIIASTKGENERQQTDARMGLMYVFFIHGTDWTDARIIFSPTARIGLMHGLFFHPRVFRGSTGNCDPWLFSVSLRSILLSLNKTTFCFAKIVK